MVYLLSLGHSLGTENTEITQTRTLTHANTLTGWSGEQRRVQALTVQHGRAVRRADRGKDCPGEFPGQMTWFWALPERRWGKGIP